MDAFTHNQECPGCGSTCVKKSESSPYKTWHGRGLISIKQYEYKCSNCKSTWSDEALIIENIAAIRHWAKLNKKLVLASDVKKLRIMLGISQEKAGELFGGGKRAFYKWEHNKNGITEAAEALFYVVLKHPELAEEIAEAKGISLAEETLVAANFPGRSVLISAEKSQKTQFNHVGGLSDFDLASAFKVCHEQVSTALCVSNNSTEDFSAYAS